MSGRGDRQLAGEDLTVRRRSASTVLHAGGTTIVVETEVRDGSDRLVAKTTQTQAVLRK